MIIFFFKFIIFGIFLKLEKFLIEDVSIVLLFLILGLSNEFKKEFNEILLFLFLDGGFKVWLFGYFKIFVSLCTKFLFLILFFPNNDDKFTFGLLN